MLSIVLPYIMQPEESLDHFCGRKRRTARNLSAETGTWAKIWGERCISWHKHIMRGAEYNHICCRILNHHDNNWLLSLRSMWVGGREGGNSRNSLFAGRTGTRLNVGRPQVRWEDGVRNAEAVIEANPIALHGRSVRTIGTIIHEAMQAMRAEAQPISN